MRPTGRGTGVAAVAAVLTAGALLLGWDGLGVLAVASLSALLLAVLTVLPTTRLRVERTLEPSRVVRGGVVLGMLDVTNHGRRGCPPLRARDTAGPEQVELDLPALAPGGRRRSTYRIPTSRRGVYPVGPLVVDRLDPLALVRRSLPTGAVLQLHVHPRAVPLRPPGAGHDLDLEGLTADVDAEGGTAFHALRPYVPGDDLRQVHWRTVARTGELVVRRTVEASRPETAVLLDDRAARWEDDELEVAVDVVASLLVVCAQHGLPASLHLTSGRQVTAPVGHVGAVLDTLAALQPNPAGPADEPALPVAGFADAARGGCAVVVTSGADAEVLAALTPVRRRARRLVLVTVRPDQPVPTGTGVEHLSVSDVDDFARLWDAAR